MVGMYGEFCKIFGDTPRNKILEVFLAMRNFDFGVGDIAKETGLNRATTYNTMKEMIKNKLFVPSRKVGKGQLYKLNREKEEIKLLISAFDNLIKSITLEYKKPMEVIA